jgi:hypothetical protein
MSWSEHAARQLKSAVTPHAPEHNLRLSYARQLFGYLSASTLRLYSQRVSGCEHVRGGRSNSGSKSDEGSQGSALRFDELREIETFRFVLECILRPGQDRGHELLWAASRIQS